MNGGSWDQSLKFSVKGGGGKLETYWMMTSQVGTGGKGVPAERGFLIGVGGSIRALLCLSEVERGSQ